jgi:hypothetical protein
MLESEIEEENPENTSFRTPKLLRVKVYHERLLKTLKIAYKTSAISLRTPFVSPI